MTDDPRLGLQYRLYAELRKKPLVRLAMAVPALAGPRYDEARFDQFLRGHCSNPMTDYGHAALLLLELWEREGALVGNEQADKRRGAQILQCIADAPIVIEARALPVPAIRRGQAVTVPGHRKLVRDELRALAVRGGK